MNEFELFEHALRDVLAPFKDQQLTPAVRAQLKTAIQRLLERGCSRNLFQKEDVSSTMKFCVDMGLWLS